MLFVIVKACLSLEIFCFHSLYGVIFAIIGILMLVCGATSRILDTGSTGTGSGPILYIRKDSVFFQGFKYSLVL